jgi:hypothetical protein
MWELLHTNASSVMAIVPACMMPGKLRVNDRWGGGRVKARNPQAQECNLGITKLEQDGVRNAE